MSPCVVILSMNPLFSFILPTVFGCIVCWVVRYLLIDDLVFGVTHLNVCLILKRNKKQRHLKHYYVNRTTLIAVP